MNDLEMSIASVVRAAVREAIKEVVSEEFKSVHVRLYAIGQAIGGSAAATTLPSPSQMSLGKSAMQAVPTKLLRVGDCARALAISERHLREAVLRGLVPCVRIGKSIRISIETLEKVARDGIQMEPSK